jgi:hypothetical protein
MPTYMVQASYTSAAWNKLVQRPENRMDVLPGGVNRDRPCREVTGCGARDLARSVALEEVVRDLPEDVPERKRRDLFDDSGDHVNTVLRVPAGQLAAGGTVAFRRLLPGGGYYTLMLHLVSRPHRRLSPRAGASNVLSPEPMRSLVAPPPLRLEGGARWAAPVADWRLARCQRLATSATRLSASRPSGPRAMASMNVRRFIYSIT